MLIIMLLGMMHSAFPHVHHQHEHVGAAGVKAEFYHHHHHEHDTDHHHHADNEAQDHDQQTFLDFLFKNHSHTKHFHQYTLATVQHINSIKQLDIKIFVSIDIWLFEVRQADDGLHRYVLFKDFLPDDPYLFTHPHRGPPLLG